MLLLPFLCWHVRPLGTLVRSWDGLAPSQDVEGSSAEVLAGGYESQSSKAIVLWIVLWIVCFSAEMVGGSGGHH